MHAKRRHALRPTCMPTLPAAAYCKPAIGCCRTGTPPSCAAPAVRTPPAPMFCSAAKICCELRPMAASCVACCCSVACTAGGTPPPATGAVEGGAGADCCCSCLTATAAPPAAPEPSAGRGSKEGRTSQTRGRFARAAAVWPGQAKGRGKRGSHGRESLAARGGGRTKSEPARGFAAQNAPGQRLLFKQTPQLLCAACACQPTSLARPRRRQGAQTLLLRLCRCWSVSFLQEG